MPDEDVRRTIAGCVQSQRGTELKIAFSDAVMAQFAETHRVTIRVFICRVGMDAMKEEVVRSKLPCVARQTACCFRQKPDEKDLTLMKKILTPIFMLALCVSHSAIAKNYTLITTTLPCHLMTRTRRSW